MKLLKLSVLGTFEHRSDRGQSVASGTIGFSWTPEHRPKVPAARSAKTRMAAKLNGA